MVANRHQTVEQSAGVDSTGQSIEGTEPIQLPVSNSMEEGGGDSRPSDTGLNTFDPSSLTTGDVHMFKAL